MPDNAVEAGGTELQRRVRATAKIQPDLAQPKQIEMVDEKRCDQYGQPTGSIEGVQREASVGVLHIPDYAAHGLPFPEQQEQRQTRK